MDLWSMAPRDVRPVLAQERAELLELLLSLDDEQWRAPTEAPGWAVKDVALHLLDDDLGWLSRGRDGNRTGLLPMDDHRTFVQALAAKNQRWVDGAQGLSRPVVVGLLGWAGEQMDSYYGDMDLVGTGHVSWAGGEVPVWFDIEQDLTERWVHQQQIRRAVGIDGGYQSRYLATVLRTFVWAFPAQYAAEAPEGTRVGIDLGDGLRWTLTRAGRAWSLAEGPPVDPAASMSTDAATSWGLLTGALSTREADDAVVLRGDSALASPMRRVRGIIV